MPSNTFSGHARIRDFQLHAVRHSQSGRLTVTGISIKGQLTVPSPRFWMSLLLRYDVPAAAWANDEAYELFQQIARRAGDDRVRYFIDRDDDGHARLLAVTGPGRPQAGCGQIDDLIARYDAGHSHRERGPVTLVRTGRLATLAPRGRLSDRQWDADRGRNHGWPVMSS